MRIMVNGTYEVSRDVTINATDALEAIVRNYKLDAVIKNGKAYYREDISHHGSSSFKDTFITNNPEMIKVYEAAKILYQYIQCPEDRKYKKQA